MLDCVALGGKPYLDSADHGGVSGPTAERQLRLREVRDRVAELADRARFAAERRLHARSWLHASRLPEVPDRTHDIDEDRETILERAVALTGLGPFGDDERLGAL